MPMRFRKTEIDPTGRYRSTELGQAAKQADRNKWILGSDEPTYGYGGHGSILGRGAPRDDRTGTPEAEAEMRRFARENGVSDLVRKSMGWKS